MYDGSSEAVSTMYILQKAPHRYEETGSASSRETTGKSRCPRPKRRLWQRCMDRIPYSTACGSRLLVGSSVWPRAGGKSRAKIVPISLLPCCSPPPGTLPSIGASTTLTAASGRPPAPACRRRCTPRLGARRVRPACQALGALAAAPHLSQHRALRCWLGAAGLEDEAELLQPLFWEFVVKMFRETVLGCWAELATGVRAGGDGTGGQEVGDRGTRRCASGSGSIRASSQAT